MTQLASEIQGKLEGGEVGSRVSPLALVGPILCLIGILLSVYLTATHYAVSMGDLSLGKACGAGSGVGCNGVLASRYGSVLGVPVALFGVGYYAITGMAFVAVLLLRVRDGYGYRRALCFLTACALLVDIYLAWAMWFRIGRVCPLCVATYAINLILFSISVAVVWKEPIDVGGRSLLPRGRILVTPGDSRYYREVLKLFVASGTVALLVVIGVVAAVVGSALERRNEARKEGLLSYLSDFEPIELPIDHRPVLGPEDGKVTIGLFSDFLCEQCRQAHEYLEVVRANHLDSLRIVYYHFPLDSACNGPSGPESDHPGACDLARAAQCAQRQDLFWEFYRAVFDDERPISALNLERYARRAGVNWARFEACLANSPLEESAKQDIELGRSIGISATPTLVLNGRPLVGAIEPRILEAAIAHVEKLATDRSGKPSHRQDKTKSLD